MVLTADERRGAVLLVILLLAGAAWDGLRAAHLTGSHAVAGEASAPADSGRAVESAIPRPPPAAGAEPRAGRASAPVDLNTATLEELDALPGIGPVLARRIVEQRARAGPFRAVDELRAVRGVGPRLLERLRPHLRVGR